MSFQESKYCLGTLAEGHTGYSPTCLRRMFNRRRVKPVLAYESPALQSSSIPFFEANRQAISISGVQEKFSVKLEKNKLRLTTEGERGTYILKPIPQSVKKGDQMPANEHLTMQIARQVYGIETAENALIYFSNGELAYLTKRFDVKADGSKWAQEDFASLAGRSPQTHGGNYKYAGNYLELFHLMKTLLPAYRSESVKLFTLLVFNYLFSNGDAHLKNFSLLETPLGDFRLSPAYDLLNSSIHIDDAFFALEDGLLPKAIKKGKIGRQFQILAAEAGINSSTADKIIQQMLGHTDAVERFVIASFMNEKTKRSYLQAYQRRLRNLGKS